jgi:hypothetical protein
MADGNLPEQLRRYWVAGPGAARIKWGTSGDFDRCIVNIQGEITNDGRKPLPDRIIKGLCATLHREATGFTPGHAPGERKS